MAFDLAEIAECETERRNRRGRIRLSHCRAVPNAAFKPLELTDQIGRQALPKARR
jgi:hypothetical protein